MSLKYRATESMVKGESKQKPQQAKRGTGKSNVQTTGKSVAGTSGKMLPQGMVSFCCGCGKIVTDEMQALQCDKCMSNDS